MKQRSAMIMRYWMDAREFRQFAPTVHGTCIFHIKGVKAWMQLIRKLQEQGLQGKAYECNNAP
jgi:hypothetical protein